MRLKLLPFLLFAFMSCNAGAPSKGEYNLSRPEVVYAMPAELKEISGLTFYNDSILLCIQDEVGRVFRYDLNAMKVVQTDEFSSNADYEDLAFTGKDLYILQSNGNLFRIKNYPSNLQAETVETPLSNKQNTEGLCFDRKNNRILIAVKDQDIDGEQNSKGVYSIDLSTGKFNDEPVLRVKGSHAGGKDNKKNKKGKGVNLRPSGIAIHPATGHFYVLTVSHQLMVYDQDGKFHNSYPLNPSLFRQPEGIAFDSNGTLYISNEGKKGRANILRFNYEKG